MIKVLLLFTLFAFLFSKEPNYTLVISFDGFMYDYLYRDNIDTPNFDRFKEEGVYASLVPVFPSLTFPNHYSIATGYHANKNKIIGNSFFSKTLDRHYSMRDSKAVQDGSFYGMEPIWVTAEKNDIKTATYFWIGSEAEINGYRPSIYKKYDGSVKFESRVDSVVSWFDLPDDSRPNLIMLYFSEPDYTGHSYGNIGKEIEKTVEDMDMLLGYIIKELKYLAIYDNLDIILLSDHGMENVSKNKVILLDEYIDIDKHEITISSAITHINSKDVNSIKNKLNNVENITVYTKDNFPDEYQFINEDSPDLIILADIGWSITTSEKLNGKRGFPKGMHGYPSYNTSMHGIFMANGPSFNQGILLEPFENINIYPILCNLLSIEPYKENTLWDKSLNNKILVR